MNGKCICSIVGHKANDIPLVRASDSHRIKLRELITQELRSLLDEGVSTFLCGMDDGTDLMCCEVLIGLKSLYPDIFLECVIPFADQPKYWLAEDRDQYFHILEKCDNEYLIEDKYTNDSYIKRNIYLATEADIIFAISKLGKLSRAETTIRYAGWAGKKIVLIHPERLTCKKMDDFKFD